MCILFIVLYTNDSAIMNMHINNSFITNDKVIEIRFRNVLCQIPFTISKIGLS